MLLVATTISFLCYQINAEASNTQKLAALRRLYIYLSLGKVLMQAINKPRRQRKSMKILHILTDLHVTQPGQKQLEISQIFQRMLLSRSLVYEFRS